MEQSEGHAATWPTTEVNPQPTIESSTPLLHAALIYAARGWPVFPCKPDQKAPNTVHGVKDATTDLRQILRWWMAHPTDNVAIATGTPGPDVFDVDVHADSDGWDAYERARRAGLLRGAVTKVQTPSGGLHLYYPGRHQRNGSLRRHAVDFRSTGGYVIAPPSIVDGVRYEIIASRDVSTGRPCDWDCIRALLDPAPRFRNGATFHSGSDDISALVRTVARAPEGQRNSILYWAARRACETYSARGGKLDDLVTAAVAAGLSESEARATVHSAVMAHRGAA